VFEGIKSKQIKDFGDLTHRFLKKEDYYVMVCRETKRFAKVLED